MRVKRAGNNNGAYIMINVTYDNGGAVREFACAGHAGYDPGNDVVCAAASALCGALTATLLKHDEEFFSLFVEERDGECRITCAGAAAAPYFELALVGLTKLAEAFPDNVRVSGYEERERRP